MKKNILNNTIFYGGSQVIGKFVTVLTLPFLLSLIDKEDYGVIAIYLGIQQILSIYISSGARPALNKYYGNLNLSGQVEILKYFRKRIVYKSFFIFIVLFIFRFLFNLNFSYQVDLFNLILVFVLTVLVAIDSLVDPVTIVAGKAYANSVLASMNSSFAPILVLILLYYNSSVTSYLLAITISYLIKIFASISLNKRTIFYGENSFVQSDVELYSKRNNFLGISQKSIRWSDRLFVGLFLGASVTGEYHAVLQLVLVLEYLTSSLVTAIKPYIFNQKKIHYGNINNLLNHAIYTTTCLGVAGSFLRYNLGQAIIPREYWVYLDYVPLIALGVIINSGYKLISVVADYESNEINYIKHSIITMILHFIACFIFINLFGLIGIILSFVITFTVNIALLVYDKNSDLGSIDIDFSRIFILLAGYLLSDYLFANFLSFAGGVQARWLISFFVLWLALIEFYKLKNFVSKEKN
ncbi:MAG: hypothetical protein CL470_08150 [Acidimicrobiaceae bacterium]|nr:hypothetical protein [Acidimicrobiaceae bacterium]